MNKNGTKYKIILTQLPHPSAPDRNVPLAAGYLKAAAFSSNLFGKIEIEILDSTYSDYAGCQMLEDILISKKPNAVGFTLYLWNVERTLNLINQIKNKLPNLIVIVGGPEAIKQSKQIVSNPNIDIVVFGEGEKTFVEIIQHLISGKPKIKDISGIGFREKTKFYVNKPRARIIDLNYIPSPYLLGYLDPQKHREILFFTMRGCMLGCSYCSWTARGKLAALNLERLEQELLFFRRSGRPLTISLIDSALNTSPVFYDFCKLVGKLNSDGLLKFNCFIQADLITESDAKMLKRSGFNSVEVGLQSSNPEVLSNVNRKVNLDKFIRGVNALKNEGIIVGVDVIVGLPGDSSEKFDKTMKFLSDNDLNPMIFQLSISKGAYLHKNLEMFGGKPQKYPPYYLKHSEEFPKKDLQQTFAKYREKYSDLDRIINLNYPSIALESLNSNFKLQNPILSVQKLKYPVKSIVIKNSPTTKFSELAEAISHKVSNNLTILYSCNDGSGETFLETLLKEILKKNKHINCIILLENQNPQKTKKQLQKSLSKKEKTFLDNRDEIVKKHLPDTHRKSINIFEIYPKINRKKGFHITTLNINNRIDKQKLERKGKISSKSGLLIDFSQNLKIDFIRECMDLLAQSNKDIYFKDWVIQRFWEQEYLRVTSTPQANHYQILFDKNSQMIGKEFNENDLLWDSIKNWKMLRREYEGLDLEKIMIEKVINYASKVEKELDN